MSEPARLLHLVDGNGEASPVCPHCVDKDQAITRLTNSYEATIRNLRTQLDAEHPANEDVRTVFDHWARRVKEEGWWSQPPKLNAPRREAISARLKDYDVQYCLDAVEGALFQSRQGVKREWVDASSIFKAGNIERHFERAQDPYCQRVVQSRKLPEMVEVLLTDPALPYLCEVCDCGHSRFDHGRPDPLTGEDPCLVPGCDGGLKGGPCEFFDDFHMKLEARKAEIEKRQDQGRSVPSAELERQRFWEES